MTDAEHTTPGLVPGLVQEFIGQLRAATEKLEGLTGFSARLPAAGAPPLPGALSAAQVTSIRDSIVAQRRSIEALQAQLSAFDEQLAVLEQILGPIADWSRSWAELEGRLLNLGRDPGEVLPELRPVTCGRAVNYSVDNDHHLRKTTRDLWK